MRFRLARNTNGEMSDFFTELPHTVNGTLWHFINRLPAPQSSSANLVESSQSFPGDETLNRPSNAQSATQALNSHIGQVSHNHMPNEQPIVNSTSITQSHPPIVSRQAIGNPTSTTKKTNLEHIYSSTPQEGNEFPFSPQCQKETTTYSEGLGLTDHNPHDMFPPTMTENAWIQSSFLPENFQLNPFLPITSQDQAASRFVLNGRHSSPTQK